MNGARFVHDTLEELGWEVLIADAQKVKGLAPLACKTDKIDARVLAVLSQRDLVPAIWLPDRRLRRERELARWRLHLVRHRTTLKNRVHATLISFGHRCRCPTCSGSPAASCRPPDIPEPWRGHVDASLQLIDDLERRIGDLTVELRAPGRRPSLRTVADDRAGVRWITSFTVACEIGDIGRFSSPVKLIGYTGLCPRVNQSGEIDRRGPISKHGSRYLRWGLMEAAMHACSTRSTPSATSTPSAASVASAAPRSRRSTSRASSPRRSGTCSPATNPSLRQAPVRLAA